MPKMECPSCTPYANHTSELNIFFSAIFASPDWFLVTSSATARWDAQNGWVPLLETKLASTLTNGALGDAFSTGKVRDVRVWRFHEHNILSYMPVYQPTKRTTRKTAQVPRWLVNFLSPTHVSGFNTHTYIYNSTPSVHIPYLYYTYWINILHHYHNSADILIYIYYNGYSFTTLQWIYSYYNGYNYNGNLCVYIANTYSGLFPFNVDAAKRALASQVAAAPWDATVVRPSAVSNGASTLGTYLFIYCFRHIYMYMYMYMCVCVHLFIFASIFICVVLSIYYWFICLFIHTIMMSYTHIYNI